MVEFFKNNQKLVIIFLLGIILIGLGVLLFRMDIFSSGDKIEVLNSSTEGLEGTLEVVVEIAGAVEKPGVYKLNNSSRVDDLLIASGGLSVNADRDWVEKYVNRASKLSDGQKLFIPSVGEQSVVLSAKDDGGIKLYQEGNSTQTQGLIDINTASLSTLDTLPGIGPVYGQKIIDHRPYSKIEELLSNGVLNSSTYEKIKNLISVY